MANIRKTFNFRNGVQVDEDNLIVNSFGLVGIGTSVPTELLDVRGTAKIIGLVTATEVSGSFGTLGVATITSLRVGGNISINSGVITATTGVATFYGDGSGLINIPTSQWIDVDSGLGFTSIYAAGFVGVVTDMPYFPFQVGGRGNLSTFANGVGIGSEGNILATGIITATTFSGSLSGNVNGNINSGIGTFGNLNIGTVTINSGIVTATTFRGNLIGNVTGTASTSLSLSGTPNIIVGIVTASKIVADTIEVPNTGITTISKLLHIGTGGTAFSATEGGRVGIGTALPTSELQIRKASESLLEVISNSGSARISVGQSVGVGKSAGVIRFGDTDRTLDIINNDTGNLNYYLHAGAAGIGTGRFEWLYGQTNAELMSLTYGGNLGLGKTNPGNTLHVVGTSTVTGNAWFGGNVTISGNLTVGSITLPSLISNTNLYNIIGVSTFSGIEVVDNATFSGNVIVSSASSVGFGTTQPIVSFDARNKDALFGEVGINTDSSQGGLTVIGGGTFSSSVGIGTTATSAYLGVYGNVDIYPSSETPSVSISIYSAEIICNNRTRVGLGTTSARSALDFADVGKGFAGGTSSFMIVPRATDFERELFGTGVGGIGTSAGALIFNTTTSKFQGYTGTAWVDLH